MSCFVVKRNLPGVTPEVFQSAGIQSAGFAASACLKPHRRTRYFKAESKPAVELTPDLV
jgi:hypothetical protein